MASVFYVAMFIFKTVWQCLLYPSLPLRAFSEGHLGYRVGLEQEWQCVLGYSYVFRAMFLSLSS